MGRRGGAVSRSRTPLPCSFIAVFSTQTGNSPWVKREIDMALAVQKEKGEGYRVLPLLLPGMKPAAQGMWFAAEPLAVPVILAGLGP